MLTRIHILADDLTGACDAAVAFAARGYRTTVPLHTDSPWSGDDADATALSTESRTLPEAEAQQRVTTAMSAAAATAGALLFKKIDSVLRGNTFAEIAAAVRCLPGHLAILAPALPAQGRTCVGGRLHLHGQAVAKQAPLAQQLARHGLDCAGIPADTSAASLATMLRVAPQVPVLVCDAQTNQQLRALADAALSLRRPILWIGAAGLAHALAETLPTGGATAMPAVQRGVRGKTIFVLGSDHAVTTAQLQHLQQTAAPGEASSIHTLNPETTSPEQLRQRILPELQAGAACLVVTGGATAALLCRAFAVRQLTLQREFCPGVPIASAEAEELAGLPLLLKSGGFGEAGLLRSIANRYAPAPALAAAGARLPRIAVTLGDPAGIGAEVTLKALADPALRRSAEWVLVGDGAALRAAESATGLSLDAMQLTLCDQHMLASDEPIAWGELRPEYGRAAAQYVFHATHLCLHGEADAMVTAPLNKEAVVRSGMAFTGHTEYIAALCGATDSRMLLHGTRLSVIHVSTHVSLRRACSLETQRIIRTIELGHAAMQLLGHAQPRIAVCGLNPHAGEHGLFGNEEEQHIVPAIAHCRQQGILCEGPFAADTIFLRAVQGSHHLVVAMYHDQGHIPMKLLDFEATVNTSLGIPILRTSVDHGTAFDIAGQNLASGTNMQAAMRMAITMATTRLRQAEEAAG
ncbi:MAG: 4-hydroxythreonine-4-phosphate dehydrogenase PdxA [Acidobacteriota bacterium]|nr:4-hydroxythreonine-4-phosphate dehydrogenase PdxA [Acidobacteriota bacterium]